jgi:hypothetical protein
MADAIRLKAPGAADQLETVTIELPPLKTTKSGFVKPLLASTSSMSTSVWGFTRRRRRRFPASKRSAW